MTRPQSSGRLGRFVDACAGVLMHRRRLLLLLCLAVTVALGCSATRLRLDPACDELAGPRIEADLAGEVDGAVGGDRLRVGADRLRRLRRVDRLARHRCHLQPGRPTF